MDSNLLKATPELIAEYLTFLVGFGSKPREALEPYGKQNAIDWKLLAFTAFSVGLAWVILRVARALGAAEDKSHIVAVVSSLPVEVLPVVAVVLTLLSAVIFHVVAKTLVPVWTAQRWRSNSSPQEPHLGGVLWNSINAGFAFSAFVIPLVFLGYAILLVVWEVDRTAGLIVMICFSVLIFASFFIYFASALSALHPSTSFQQARATLGAFVVVLVILRIIIEKIFETVAYLFG